MSNPSDFLNQENDVWNIFNGLRIRKTIIPVTDRMISAEMDIISKEAISGKIALGIKVNKLLKDTHFDISS